MASNFAKFSVCLEGKKGSSCGKKIWCEKKSDSSAGTKGCCCCDMYIPNVKFENFSLK